MREQMSPTSFIVVQTHHLMADRTFSIERMKSPPSQELYELNNPYDCDTHGHLCAVELKELAADLLPVLGRETDLRDAAPSLAYRTLDELPRRNRYAQFASLAGQAGFVIGRSRLEPR
jgi:hypothetical protein